MELNKINTSIHGLRGFAAICVVFFHIWDGATKGSFLPSYIPNIIEKPLTSLSFGVDLFFMISGYLITFSVINHGTIRNFIRNRCIRVYPAFLPVLLLIFIFGPFIGYDYFDTVNSFSEWLYLLIANIFFIPGVFPMDAALLVAWTLSYEAAFYIFCALSYFFYRKSPSLATKFLIVFSALVLCVYYPRALFFLIGASAHFFYNHLDAISRVYKRFSFLYLITFFLGMVFLSASLNLPQYILLLILTYLVSALLFAGVVKETGSFSLFLNLSIFQFLGTISYSLYLWHTPIMFVTKKLSLKFFYALGDTFVFVSFGLSR